MQNWPVPKKRDTNYNVALRSSPGANKSFKDRGNDFGNGPISIEPRRCLEKKRHGPTIFSTHCCSFETKLEPAARKRPMQLIALFIGAPPRENESKHNLNVSRLKRKYSLKSFVKSVFFNFRTKKINLRNLGNSIIRKRSNL